MWTLKLRIACISAILLNLFIGPMIAVAAEPNVAKFSGGEAKSAIKHFLEHDPLAKKNEWIKESGAILEKTKPVELDGTFVWGPWQVTLKSGDTRLDSDVATLEGSIQRKERGIVRLKVSRIILVHK